MKINSLFKYVTGIVKLRGADNTIIGNNGNKLLTEPVFPADQLTPFRQIRAATSLNTFQSIFNFDKQPLFWSESTATGGTSTHNLNTSSVDMAVTTASGSSVIRQSKRRIRYNPAAAVRVKLSANAGGLKANCRRRLGQFSVNNGLFFEITDTASIVVRSSTSGSPVDTPVAQSAWNTDKLDGTGVSGLNIDFSKHQIFVIDYIWHGTGEIRFGFYLNGQVHYCHKINYANTLTVPYMRNAHLPIRFEITNTGTTASNTTMSNNVCVVKQENYDEINSGIPRSFNNVTPKTISTTSVPVMSVRVNSTYILGGIFEILKTAIMPITANDYVVYEVYLNPTLTGATFANQIGILDIDTAATAMSGGTMLDSGLLTTNVSSDLYADTARFATSILGSDLNNVSDIVTIAAKVTSGSADVISAITWKEW